MRTKYFFFSFLVFGLSFALAMALTYNAGEFKFDVVTFGILFLIYGLLMAVIQDIQVKDQLEGLGIQKVTSEMIEAHKNQDFIIFKAKSDIIENLQKINKKKQTFDKSSDTFEFRYKRLPFTLEMAPRTNYETIVQLTMDTPKYIFPFRACWHFRRMHKLINALHS